MSVKKCRFTVKPNGLIIEETSGLPVDKPETLKKILAKCGTRGAHFGRNPFASEKAMNDVKNFVKKVFGL